VNIVVDTSAIIAVLTDEWTKQAIIEATQEATLISPASLPFEIGNAFSAMFKRRASSLDEALEAMRIFDAIPIRLVDVDLGKSIILAKDLNVYAYDAYMLEVANRHNAPIITLDDHLIEAAEKKGIKTIRVR
jgi:predicted nucleic acid-binding protein